MSFCVFGHRWVFDHAVSLDLPRAFLDMALHYFKSDVATVLLCVCGVLTLLQRCFVHKID